jgi:hypothetical protein
MHVIYTVRIGVAEFAAGQLTCDLSSQVRAVGCSTLCRSAASTRYGILLSRFPSRVHLLSRFCLFLANFYDYSAVSCCMLPDMFCMLPVVFLLGCRLSETGTLVISVSSVARNRCLDEVCFLINWPFQASRGLIFRFRCCRP